MSAVADRYAQRMANPRRMMTARRSGRRVLRGVGLAGALVLLAGCLTIQNKSVPRLYVGMPVSIPMTATGAKGSLTWSATGLPGGLAIDPATGVISGTPQQAGSSTIDVRAVDTETGDAVTTSYPYDAVVPASFVSIPVAPSPYAQAQYYPAISEDGRFVAHLTTDGGLQAPGDTGFPGLATALWDRTTGTVTKVSTHWNDIVSTLAISGDGRFVSFQDVAPPPQTGPASLKVWDRLTGTTEEVPDQYGSLNNSGGLQSLSYDGRYLSWLGRDADGSRVGLLYDRVDRTTTRITPALPILVGVALSEDGSTVAYASEADGIVGGDTDGRNDVFLWDRATGTTTSITDDQAGSPDRTVYSRPAISGDGKTVVYVGDGAGTNQSVLYLWDRTSGITRRITGDIGLRKDPILSSDGSTVVYERQGAGLEMWDRATGATTQVTPDSSFGPSPDYAVSGNGGILAIGRHPFMGPEDVVAWDRSASGVTP